MFNKINVRNLPSACCVTSKDLRVPKEALHIETRMDGFWNHICHDWVSSVIKNFIWVTPAPTLLLCCKSTDGIFQENEK